MASWARVGWLLGGWLLGVATAAGVAGAAAHGLAARGVVVPVAVGRVGEQVQSEVEAAVLAGLPEAVQALKGQVSARVAAEVRRRLANGSFQLGNFPIVLPADLLGAAFDEEVGETVSSALDGVAAAEAGGPAARAVASHVAAVVRQRLTAAVTDWRVTLRPWRYLAVPVSLQPQP